MNGHSIVQLHDLILESQNGLSKRSGADGVETPVLRLADIKAGAIDESAPREIRLTAKELAKYALQQGDLVCIRVNGSKALVGRVIQFRASRVWAYCDHFIRFRPNQALVDHRYLAHYFNSQTVRRHIELNMVSSAGQNTVSQSTMLSIPVPCPGLETQREIVAELEKQFSRLDEAVANLQRVKANFKRYKASVLKAAVEGRLVETEAALARREGRTYETGEQLLQRLLEVRRTRPNGKSKYKEPALPNLEAVTTLPEGWAWASVDQVVAHLTDGDHQAPPQTDSGVPFLVIGNVRTGEIDLTDTRFVGEDYYNSLDAYRQPVQGDLLYTLVGSYGIPVRVKTAKRFCIQRHMAILRPHAESPMDYLAIAMASDRVFKQATEVSTGTAQMTVPLSGLRSIAIGLPPKAEQARIVAEVDRNLSLVREVEAEVDANLKRAQALRQSVLTRAFSGEVSLGSLQPLRNAASETRPSKPLESATVVMAARIIAAHCHEPTFGRVRLQKQLHLATYIAQVATNDEYARKQAGPLDMTMLSGVTKRVNDLGWFRETERADKLHGGKAYGYSALTKADEYKQHLNALTPTQQKVIDELIRLMRNWTTEQCELFSTVYAAWNDLILWNRPPTEQAVIDQVHNHWHESKKKFSAEKIAEMMHKIKDWGYTPLGFGRPTFGQAADTVSGDLFPSQAD